MTPRRPGAIRRRVPHFRGALPAMAGFLIFAVVAGALANGTVGAVGAAIGVAGVALSYVISGLAIAWADSINSQLVLPVGLATYGIKFCLLGVVLVSAYGTDWPGIRPMAFAIIAATVVWNAAHLTWLLRARIPYVDLDDQR